MKHILNLKSVALVAMLLVCGFLASAQSWQTSKDVQRVANKQMFSDEKLAESHVNATSAEYPLWTMSKGVVAVSNKQDLSANQGKGNVVSNYPMWAVSKGVAVMGSGNSVKKSEQEDNSPKDPSLANSTDVKKKNKRKK